jgi:anti-sigma28 factor (negative regulator of flagellin synthesis)
MPQFHPHYQEPLQARLETLRERIRRDEYLPDDAQIADKFIDLERILPALTRLHIRSAG